MSATAKQDQAATAVAEWKSEKNKVWDETRDGVIINHIKHKTYLLVYKTSLFSHFLSASGLESDSQPKFSS